MNKDQRRILDKFLKEGRDAIENFVAEVQKSDSAISGKVISELERILRGKDVQYDADFIGSLLPDDIQTELARLAQSAIYKFWQSRFQTSQIIYETGLIDRQEEIGEKLEREVKNYVKKHIIERIKQYSPTVSGQREQKAIDIVRRTSKAVPKESKEIIKSNLLSHIQSLLDVGNDNFAEVKKLVDLVRYVIRNENVNLEESCQDFGVSLSINQQDSLRAIYDLSFAKTAVIDSLNLPDRIPESIFKNFVKDRVMLIMLRESPEIRSHVENTQLKRSAARAESVTISS